MKGCQYSLGWFWVRVGVGSESQQYDRVTSQHGDPRVFPTADSEQVRCHWHRPESAVVWKQEDQFIISACPVDVTRQSGGEADQLKPGAATPVTG